MQRNIRKLVVFAGMPLAAIALAAFLMGWGNGSAQKAHATVDPAVNLSLSVKGGTCNSNGSNGSPAAVKGAANTCSVSGGSVFTINFNVDSQVASPGWAGYDMKVSWDGNINYNVGSLKHKASEDPKLWSGCDTAVPETGNVIGVSKQGAGTPAAQLGTGTVSTGCADAGAVDQLVTLPTVLAQFSMTCKASGSGHVTLVHGDGNSDLVDSSFAAHSEAGPTVVESLLINCVPATNTPLPTATNTPPAVPAIRKLPVLQNVFLQRQGAKIPPATCQSGTGGGTLTETIIGPGATHSPDPKIVGAFQQLGAFEFEMRFDAKIVCVSVVGAGPFAPGPAVVCSTLDNGDKGLVRFGCFTIKKNNNLNAACATGCAIAVITVKAQPEVFSQLRPNQDNGIPVQILNQGCQLSDDQGHTIPISSCEDADITFRFLEGDVTGPNCAVNSLDAQNIAMRWGARKGSLLYNSFMDLSPSGQIKGDGRIDIQDLQFVFGRLNSTCAIPWPAQPPVNPKA